VRAGGFAVAVVASLLALAAQAQTPLRLIAFEGGWNLPVWAAQRQGFFEANGLSLVLSYTPNSVYQVTALLDDRVDVALTLIDNVVAYQEGQGEAKVSANPDLFAFCGSDGGFASLVAAPAVTRIADLKGRTVSVDAMTTGLAFVVRELLARNGLAETDVTLVRVGGTASRYRDLIAGKQAATLLRTPFDVLAGERGFHSLAAAQALGSYQGTVGAARRSWAASHEAELVGFLRAYRSGVDWLYDRANRDLVEAMLVANIRDMTPALARQSYDLLLADPGGITRDIALDTDGIRTVLALRSRYGTPRKTLTDPAPYIDRSYYDKAFGKR
jgi:ABC-type nitrate/sulfonate/bicarbonate transport system substrate-binding protein